MTDTIIVQLPSDEQQPCRWVRVDNKGITGSVVTQPLEELFSEAPDDCQWAAILPGEYVRTVTTTLPKKRRNQAIQALPFMLEDQIASDIQLEHFVPGSDNDDGQTVIAICRKAYIQQWLDVFNEANIELRSLVPDYSLVAPATLFDNNTDESNTSDENTDAETGADVKPWQLALTEDRVFIRASDHTGFSAPLEQLTSLLSLLPQSETGEPNQIALITEVDSLAPELPVNWEVTTQNAVVSWFQDVAPNVLKPELDLLQGEFQAQTPKSDMQWRPWLAAAIFAGVSILLHLVNTQIENVRYQNETQQIRDNMTRLVKDALPNVKRIQDPQAQLEIAWRQVRNQGSSGGGDQFLVLIDSISPFITEQKLNVRGIRYQDNKFSVSLEGKSLQQLDTLREKIQKKVKANKLQATLENATTDAETARSDLIIAAVNTGRKR